MTHPLLRICFIAILTAASAQAAVKPSALFSDHAVLQSGVAAAVWGSADPGEKVTVTIAGQTQSTTADAQGAWRVNLTAMPAGGPHEMTIAGKNTLKIKDVLVGEVWLCSGQSNMAMRVNSVKNAKEEQAAGDHPTIRMFTVGNKGADSPQRELTGAWIVATPQTVGSFSATAYFFGRDIQQKTGRAVGLINSSVGGTPIEAWISLEAQKAMPELAPTFERYEKFKADWASGKTQAENEKLLAAWKLRNEKLKKAGKPLVAEPRLFTDPATHTGRPANLYNGKIEPLAPYAIRGAIWYQGESNANYLAALYRYQLPTLIRDWRSRWGQGDFPFYFVQLPNIGKPQETPVVDSAWCLVQEGELRTLSMPNTGMAITTDVGEATDIHPKDKQSVGQRLARLALHDVYGQKDLVRSGPVFKSLAEKGGKLLVTFDHADGLKTADGSTEIKGFAIAGADRQFQWAKATLSGNAVLIDTQGQLVASVRYNWAPNPAGTLMNSAGLPASPFRTDDWPSKATSR